jgi:hypothetical protein
MAVSKQTKGKKSINNMLIEKGFDPMAEKVGTVIDVDGKEYIVSEVKGKRVFEEYVPDSDDELVEEEYDEDDSKEQPSKPEVETKPEPKPETKPETKDEWVEADPVEKPKKKAAPKRTKKAEPEEDDTPADEEVKMPEKVVDKVAKPRGRKPKNPDKPKRTREPTKYNEFIKLTMPKVIEMYPDMTNNDRMKECSKLWQQEKLEKQAVA